MAPYVSDILLTCIGSQTGASIVWSSAELITQRLARNKPIKRYHGIHPGAHIAVQILLATGQGTSGGLTLPYETASCYSSSWSSRPCTDPGIDVVVGTLGFVLW